jgi:(4S)-4-hydroxy-5-phosphonooxypentane-2,3-dione isomerase
LTNNLIKREAKMIIVHVYLHAKKEMINAFRDATIKNARNSVQEPGIIRFDILQQEDDTSRFLAVEIFRDEKAMSAHKETEHYKEWLANAVPMLAETRTRKKYVNRFPDDSGW